MAKIVAIDANSDHPALNAAKCEAAFTIELVIPRNAHAPFLF